MTTRWIEFQPSKTALFWTCALAVGATLVVGFTWGGWTTDGNAEALRSNADYQARTELAANLCIDRFAATDNAADKLAAFRTIGPWEQRDLIRTGGWTKVTGLGDAVESAITLCTERMQTLQLPRPVATK